MPDKSFQLEVITPDRSAVAGEMHSVQVTAADGLMGIWADHAPLIGRLASGELRCRDTRGKEKLLATGDGFVEIYRNQVKVLCDFAEFPEEIDLERAEKALERAKERLAKRSAREIDEVRAEGALKRALVRLKLGGKGTA
jgi:F-type H+-transporting ATPase subunit epsilon